MKIPGWAKRTARESIICLFCGSLVVQAIQGWMCTEKTCHKHHDLPAEQVQEPGQFVSAPSVFTPSGTAGDTGSA